MTIVIFALRPFILCLDHVYNGGPLGGDGVGGPLGGDAVRGWPGGDAVRGWLGGDGLRGWLGGDGLGGWLAADRVGGERIVDQLKPIQRACRPMSDAGRVPRHRRYVDPLYAHCVEEMPAY